jgi:hypothetical protein
MGRAHLGFTVCRRRRVCGLGAKDGDVPRVPGAGEDADGVQCGEGRSMTSTALSIASSSEAELRLEASGGAPLWFSRFLLDLMQGRMKKGDQEVRQRKEKRLGGKRGTRAHQSHWDRAEKLAERADSDEGLRRF